MKTCLALPLCLLVLLAAGDPLAAQEWIGVDGRIIQTPERLRRLDAALAMCHHLDSGDGILGGSIDFDSSCMAAQGFFLSGTLEAATRPIVP